MPWRMIDRSGAVPTRERRDCSSTPSLEEEMTFRSEIVLTVLAVLGLAGCAAGAASGPLVSPTGREYPPGTPPSNTSFTQEATLAIAQGQFEDALAKSREGIADEPGNPQHYFLAGEAAAALGQFEVADSMFNVAEEIYPAYELEVEPTREAAWAEAFNTGVEAYNANSVEEAITAWRGANLIYPYRPDAAQNLATVLTQETEYEEAIEVYREGLASLEMEPATRIIEEPELTEREESRAFMMENLAQLLLYTDQFEEAEELLREQLAADPANVELQANLANALGRLGREEEASEIYGELLSAPDVTPSQLFNIGVSLFNANEYIRAAEAFGRVTEVQANHRDAWYNQANALYAAEVWEDLVPIAEELVEVDPLNENAALILARAYRELDDNPAALEALERVEALPIFIDELQMVPGADATTVTGTVIGKAASPGTPIQLTFTFYDDSGEVGTESVTVNAPAPEESTTFRAQFAAPASAYRYDMVQ
ncbi:MAG: tetratricopeptide repeat protein [Gemmatimonas sp.]|nr:tetratricopeptide repeat protein [Gemmatimonas sp.]